MSEPKIIAIAGGKGGTGKSTLTVNYAAGLVKKGFTVAIVDLDPKQESISDIYGKSNLSNIDIYIEINERLIAYDYVLLDYPPDQSTKIIAPNVIVVLEPDTLSERAFFNWQENIKGKNTLFVFNKVDTRINDERKEARELANKYKGLVIPKRRIYRNASNESKTVFCYDKKFGASEARNDINLLIGLSHERF